jgi:CMP-N,N'-diacetyllegionaminic acid synthase
MPPDSSISRTPAASSRSTASAGEVRNDPVDTKTLPLLNKHSSTGCRIVPIGHRPASLATRPEGGEECDVWRCARVGRLPARRGSSGIPGKNTIALGGQPLIQWTIDAAVNSKYIDRAQGLAVVDRPSGIAGDAATADEVIAHVLGLETEAGILVYLQPTSPLREAHDIDACLDMLDSTAAEGVVSVTATTEHPEWMYRLDPADSGLDPIVPDHAVFRRQDLPRTVKLNGALYCAPARLLLPDGNFFRLRLAGYEMPASRSIDIDSPEDLELAARRIRSRG